MALFVRGSKKQYLFLCHMHYIIFYRTMSYVDMKESKVRGKTQKTNYSGCL